MGDEGEVAVEAENNEKAVRRMIARLDREQTLKLLMLAIRAQPPRRDLSGEAAGGRQDRGS